MCESTTWSKGRVKERNRWKVEEDSEGNECMESGVQELEELREVMEMWILSICIKVDGCGRE